ncbi:E3 ubiquitin-protein ligase RNF138 isoform X4 [Cricetulus griseus]|uniref:E3 ubiquitin-protein ligase RNF138 isoform X4 n=1 Tax=Cricetulus griseus TaxID=10029 RepID=A0A9J7KDA1_CRIGR|nr:E3 ubiquitin-protein ligase RNF138 isoform X4 [Cricetulus griseus]XP_035317736.1 E3 ubiquitin-protein ligase RNF138 isoform X4 [Cricetulus griseus]
MAEEESASTSYTEDDFYCPICQEVFRTPVRVAACQHVFYTVANSNSEASTSENAEAYQEEDHAEPADDQPTFDCPLCEEGNMTRQRLLDHCNTDHRGQVVPVICPICLSLPWGDPTQLTRNFVSHLNQRHQFDYGDYVNLQLDEETQYQIAIEESFHVNI